MKYKKNFQCSLNISKGALKDLTYPPQYLFLHLSYCNRLLSIPLFRGEPRVHVCVCHKWRPQVADIIWRVSLCRQQILKCRPDAIPIPIPHSGAVRPRDGERKHATTAEIAAHATHAASQPATWPFLPPHPEDIEMPSSAGRDWGRCSPFAGELTN